MATKILNRGTFVVATVCYLLALLIGPRVDDAEIQRAHLWLVNFDLPGAFGISLNKDSFFYMDAAVSPQRLFSENNILQSRPLFPVLMYAPTKIIDAVLDVFVPGAISDVFLKKRTASYVAFLVANASLLLISLAVVKRLLELRNGGSGERSGYAIEIGFALAFLFVANDVTKAFFYAAHTQLFNILVPIVTIYALLTTYKRGLRKADLARWSVFFGLGALAYGLFLVGGIAILLMILLDLHGRRERTGSDTLANVLIVLLFVFLPYIIWVGVVYGVTGRFYSHEVVAWKQVVWMAEVAQKGIVWLLFRLSENFWFFAKAMVEQIAQFAAIPLLLLFYSLPVKKDLIRQLQCNVTLIKVLGGLICLFLIFVSIVGYKVSRLAFPATTVAIFLLCLWGRELGEVLCKERRGRLLLAMWFLLAFHGGIVVLKQGPFT